MNGNVTPLQVAGQAASPPTPGVYLRNALAPFETLLARGDVTDIYVNRPGEIWFETIGGNSERSDDNRITESALLTLARQVAAVTHQGVNREQPLLSATLPGGSRIQVVAPPATRGSPAIAIRKHVAARVGLADYEASGAFASTRAGQLLRGHGVPEEVSRLVSSGRLAEALASAVRQRLNILVSGGTSTGKTTFLNALIREIPSNERLLLIEDTPELQVDHPNQLGLVAVRGSLGEAQVSANDLVSASLRMRPDRIILGELRGAEALAFLRAVNSGHPGSMTTIHADSPETAVEQLALLVLESGTSLGREDVRHYVTDTIDVFVQLQRIDGQRRIDRLVLRTPA